MLGNKFAMSSSYAVKLKNKIQDNYDFRSRKIRVINRQIESLQKMRAYEIAQLNRGYLVGQSGLHELISPEQVANEIDIDQAMKKINSHLDSAISKFAGHLSEPIRSSDV